jgi:hypothetical protein
MTPTNLWRACVLVWLCAGPVLMCTGCGGGDCPEDDPRCTRSDTLPLDCKANPKDCA